jgi:hypothetical protein
VNKSTLPFLTRAVSIGLALAYALPAAAADHLTNPGFEDPSLTPGAADYHVVDAGTVPGWATTATDNRIELWTDGFIGVTSYEGAQHAELNANQVSTLYQDLDGIAAGSLLSFQFAHRGRAGVDTLLLTITSLGADSALGGGDDVVLFTKQYSTDNTAWSLYTSSSEAPIIASGFPMRFAFESVDAAGGDPRVGNFLDAVDFGLGVAPPAPIPTPSIGLLGQGLLVTTLGLLGAFAGRRRRAGRV